MIAILSRPWRTTARPKRTRAEDRTRVGDAGRSARMPMWPRPIPAGSRWARGVFCGKPGSMPNAGVPFRRAQLF